MNGFLAWGVRVSSLREERRSAWMMLLRTSLPGVTVATWWLVGLALGGAAQAERPLARFVQEIPGGGEGVLVKCDLQHRFYSELHSVTQFSTQAADSGCRVVFVAPSQPTHNSQTLSNFLRDVETARKLFPQLLIVPAYPWQIRSGGYSDRAMVILPPGEDFQERFLALSDLLPTSLPTSEALGHTLELLFPEGKSPSEWPAVIFTQRVEGITLHRWMVQQHSPERLWSADGELPPSQRLVGQIGLLDRWDSYDLRCGNQWDQLLAAGWNTWAAAEGFDVDAPHLQRTKPGAFTETWLRLPAVTHDGVVQAVKHGAFFGVRGQAARDVELKLTASGLHRPAFAGETVDVPAGTVVRLELSLTVPDLDWRQAHNRLDGIELIAVTPDHSRIVRKESTSRGRVVLDYETEVPEGGILFRALGYRDVADGPNYGFYTNPIRVVASGRWARAAVDLPPEPWLRDRTGMGVMALMIILSLSAVAGWLGYTGKFQLLFGDVFAPVRRRWKSSRLRRRLVRIIPTLGRRTRADHDLVGTALTEKECRRLVVLLIAGVAVLGGVSAASADPARVPIPGLAFSLMPRIALGTAAGGIWGWLLRSHPFLGVWAFLSARLSALLWPEQIPASLATALLTAAMVGFAVHEAVRAGSLRWPANASAGSLLFGGTWLVAATVLEGLLPAWGGRLALLVGMGAASLWALQNFDGSRLPMRLPAVALAAALWGSVLAAQGNFTASAAELMFVVAEALGVGCLWLGARTERLDAAGVILMQAALASIGVIWSAATEDPAPIIAAGAAGVGAILLAASEGPLLATLSAGVAILVLGRTMLFPPNGAGAWLVGAASCLAASLAGRHVVRSVMLFLPWVIIGGYWSFGGDDALHNFSTDLRGELAALPFDAVSSSARVVGQFLALGSLTSLAVLHWSLRDPRRNDIFDATGRTIVGLLIFGGLFTVLGVPFSGAAGVVAAGVAGLWASQVRSETLSFPAAPRETDSLERTLGSFRRNLGVAAVVAAGLIAYGSLVPLQWRDVSWQDAVQDFLSQFQHHWNQGTLHKGPWNSDRVINVLLTVPFAFCVYGSLVLGRRSVTGRGWAAFEAWQMSVLFSVLIEFAQHWSAGRVASAHDVASQAAGAVLGIALWVALGERFTLNFAAAWQTRSVQGRWMQLLWPYLWGVLVFAVLPAGLPVTSPKQLYDHFREGRLSLIPFADCSSWRDVVRDATAGIALFVPVGMWGAMAFRRAGQPLRSVWRSTGVGTAFAALITLLRSLFSAEMTDSSWLLTGAIGAAAGAATLHWLISVDSASSPGWRYGLPWCLGALGFVVVVVGFYLHPWEFDAAPEQAAAGWKRFVNAPFAGFHSGSDLLLMEEVVRKLAWFGAWGLLLGQAIRCSTASRGGRLVGTLTAIVLAACVGMGVEIAQLYQSTHNGEITDVVVYVCGVAVGLWLRSASPELERSCSPPPVSVPVAAELPRWQTRLQTAIAVALAIGLLSGIVLLFLRR